MASFVNRGTKHKPSWQYTISRYVDGKYKPIRKGGFRTKAEAEREALEIEQMIKRGESLLYLTEIPFEEYFYDWYRRYKRDVTPRTLKHYEFTHKYICEYFGETPIQKITRNKYQDFLNSYGERYAKETMSKVNGHIKACVLDAIEDGVIRIDFTRNANVIGKAAKSKHEKYLNFEESDKLYNELMNRLNLGLSYYAVLLLLVSGIRYEELVGLTRDDFDFKNNTISINKTWGYNRLMPEGFGPTKNESSIRVISIDPKVMKEFKKLFLQTPNNIHKLVFFSPTSKYKVLSNNAVNKTLKKVLKDIGAKNMITAHELRHTHASALIYKKVSIIYISERLGHSSPDITYKRYSHLMKELRQEDEKTAINLY